jgi:excisionase family DNA binding protein
VHTGFAPSVGTQGTTQQFGGRTNMDAAAKQHEREHLVAELFGADPATEVLAGRLLRTREVALLFQVSERAVTDWARKGRLPSVRTPGGHRRYPADLVQQLLVQTGRSSPDTA